MDINTNIQFLKGVGEVRAKLFSKLDIASVGDLLRFYPRTYADWSKTIDIDSAPLNEVCCIKAIVDSTPTAHKAKGNTMIYKTYATDGKSIILLTFFNNKYVVNSLKAGEEFLFYGKVTNNLYGGREMLSPQFLIAKNNEIIRPIYRQTERLTSRVIENCVSKALKESKEILKETLPVYLLEKYALMGLYEALYNIHFPASQEVLEKARRRLVFEELLTVQLGLLSIRERGTRMTAMPVKNDYINDFFPLLPFKPTNAQIRAVLEIFNDMKKKKPMNRLLQGDVGSGKTAVAAAVIYNAAKNGIQSALMAPTEILAEQHLRTFLSLFQNTNIKIAILTGSIKATEKRKIKEKLSNGEIDLVIGTHALLQEDVAFNRLGLVITDEQHRFGIKQRAALTKKGNNPHVLVMSATPIPRTLALIFYGDLDISVIDELPPGRQEIKTYKANTSYRNRVYKFIKKHIDIGQQAYIICPLIEDSESELVPAQEYAKKLSIGEFKDYEVGLLHGKMKASQKDTVMRSFAEGKIQLLVATIVVEVGVDVPNATVMMIENAEMFGLSQLHQLRGRIGRGKNESTCILISDADNEEAQKRFEVLCNTSDGFKIAEEDLNQRGPGDFFGKRQHGLLELKIANVLTDIKVLNASQQIAKAIIHQDKDLNLPEHEPLKRAVNELFNRTGTAIKN